MPRKSVSIYGATGVIGGKTLEVIEAYPDMFQVDVLAGWHNGEELAKRAKKVGARSVVLADEKSAHVLKEMLQGTSITWSVGEEAYVESAQHSVDIFVAAMGGTGGLRGLVAAIPHVHTMLIANKESLVVAGDMVMQRARTYGCRIIPLDSEHYAAWVLCKNNKVPIRKLTLTASGGPFLGYSHEELKNVTVQDALQHPVWKMGEKITIDSATLMNKSLELLEARALFALHGDDLSVLIHPSCLIHALMEDQEGAWHSFASHPDMLFFCC